MSNLKRRAVILALALAGGVHVLAAPIVINLATFAPKSSAWEKLVLDMGEAWKKSTEGRVTLNVYAGGQQGTDQEVVAMMRRGVNHLQASLMLQPGLAEIDDSVNVFGLPFFLESDEEMRAVYSKLQPVVAKRLEAKGFQVLHWGVAGWVQIFSKKPVKTLTELKQTKLYTTAGDDRMVQWYKSNGFNPVALNFIDIVAQLKIRNGMIDAVPSPPLGANLLQFFRDAPYMLDLPLSPVVGATVITEKAWNTIAPDDRTKMLAAAASMEKQIMAEAPSVDANSIAAMQKRGLTVFKPDAAAMKEFRAAADRLLASMRGSMVPTDVYDLAVRERDAFRKKAK